MRCGDGDYAGVELELNGRRTVISAVDFSYYVMNDVWETGEVVWRRKLRIFTGWTNPGGRSGMGLEVLESTVQNEDPISGEGRRSIWRNL